MLLRDILDWFNEIDCYLNTCFVDVPRGTFGLRELFWMFLVYIYTLSIDVKRTFRLHTIKRISLF